MALDGIMAKISKRGAARSSRRSKDPERRLSGGRRLDERQNGKLRIYEDTHKQNEERLASIRTVMHKAPKLQCFPTRAFHRLTKRERKCARVIPTSPKPNAPYNIALQGRAPGTGRATSCLYRERLGGSESARRRGRETNQEKKGARHCPGNNRPHSRTLRSSNAVRIPKAHYHKQHIIILLGPAHPPAAGRPARRCAAPGPEAPRSASR